MLSINGWVMSGDCPVVRIEDGLVKEVNKTLSPFFFLHNIDFTAWLESRSVDFQRANAKLLKEALNLQDKGEAESVLFVNAATVTDNYWFRPDNESISWNDVRFSNNPYDMMALKGEQYAYSIQPSRTPELTNIGSFEKCWRLTDGKWQMIKSGNDQELFSEIFICQLGKTLGFDMAGYSYEDGYVVSPDFTNNGEYILEPASFVMSDNEDYDDNFEFFAGIADELAEDYLRIIYMDSLCYNMDRHTSNYGFLRDPKTGDIVSLAPNYDNNIALISRGYPKDRTRENDALIGFLTSFLEHNRAAFDMFRNLDIPEIDREMIENCLDNVPIEVDRDYIIDFILNGQEQIKDFVYRQSMSNSQTMS